jgi:uncharacterized protein YqhQ
VLPQAETRPELQIGGQAVIEGVVMRGPESWALAVRRPCGDMFVTVNPVLTLAQRYPRWNVFGIRGIFALADSLIIGVKALSVSGSISLEEVKEQLSDEEADASVGIREKKDVDGSPGDGLEMDDSASPVISAVQITIALVLALGLFLGLFIVLPTLLASPLNKSVHNTVVYNLIEGGIRVAIFVLYLAAMSIIPDIRRVFQYHGAEHKVVHAYEAGGPLTPEYADRFSTAHMRCGTAFILLVFVIGILVFSLMGRPALWLRVLERLAIIPLVAALSYEIIKVAGRHEDSRALKIIMAPGLLLQKLTTKQPDTSQLEVAIASLEAAIKEPEEAASAGI